jgi:hypothetical protein
VQPSNTLLSRSRAWLAEHREDGRKAFGIEQVEDVFPAVPPLNLVHILVVTNERRFIFVDIIVTCLTCALVLEGLDVVGNINLFMSKRTPVFCVSTAVLLIMARQSAKGASNHSGSRSPSHQPVFLPLQACGKSFKDVKTTSIPGDLQEISAPLFPFSVVTWGGSTITCAT